ncbi:thioesterase II family protein [Streptomyces noursei]|uniref:thioesterase II family protein n=1 Tax=Streptomyces noursei TaxID=1971 RepID=UPI0005C904E5|nr:thioesterase domain-containing protein [Streptomyces noursei]
MCASNPTPATVSWIAARHAPGTLRSRLICLPHAGGGAGTFRSWRPHLPDGVELAPVELPGRGSRIDEPLPQSFDTLVDALFEGLRGEFTPPYAFFGHSFGALLGYELTRRIEREIERGAGLRPPSVLLVSGSRAPHVPLDGEPVADGDEARLVAWLRSSGGLPDELLDFPDFLRDLLRAVRSDMAFAEGYRIPRPAAVGCPLVAFAGAEDAVSPVAHVAPWNLYTTAEHRMHVLPGGHYFPQSHPRTTVTAVAEELAALSAR